MLYQWNLRFEYRFVLSKCKILYLDGRSSPSAKHYEIWDALERNPEDGRFLTEDTYRGETNEPDTQHLYAYCVNNPVNYVDPSGHVAVKVANGIAGAFIGVAVDVGTKAFIHYIAKRGSLNGFKVTGREIATSAFSGLVDGILSASRLKRNLQMVAGSAKAALMSYIKYRRRNIKTVVKNVLLDAAYGGVSAYISGDGIGCKYWNKGLFHKGHYTYKSVTIKYGTKIKITSKSFRMTKSIAKESAIQFAQGVGRTIGVTAINSLLKKCKKWLK